MSRPVSDPWRALGLALSVVLAGTGCTTDHDALARQPGSNATGGKGGAAGFGGSSFGNSGTQAQGGRYNPDYEPPGDDVLTVVNGAIDASGVALCFARVTDDGATVELIGSPSAELPYGRSTVLTALDGLSPTEDSIQPWVLAGDLSRIAKLDCAGAVELAQSLEAQVTPAEDAAGGAGGAPPENLEAPKLRARPLAALPPGSLKIGRSLLMVLSGCLGGAYYRDKLEASICGPDYAPDAPTLAPLLVTLSRAVQYDKVGLQALHALPASGTIDVRVSGNLGATALVFATGLELGTIAPRPADVRFSAQELGISDASYGLQALDQSGNVLYQATWSSIFESSGIAPLEVARSYTVVALGPDPLLIKKGWWNQAAFALVDNDPTRK